MMADVRANSSLLRKQCAEYARKYGYKDTEIEHGLEGYAAHLFAQEDGFNAALDGLPTAEADLRDRICRANDLGVDAVLQDEVGKRLILIQAAWRKKSVEEDKVAAFFDAPDRLASSDYRAKGGDQVQELFGDFEFALNEGWEITLRFVTNVRIGQDDRLATLVDAKNAQYQDRGQDITCELYGESELNRRDEELRAATLGGITQEASFNFQSGKVLELTSPYRTVLGVVKGNELVDLYRRRGVGNSLFNLNIRLPLTSKKVNSVLVETAVDKAEGKHFFYYNNGVSAVCSEYELKGNRLTAKRFQIINGAQTVSALVNAFRQAPNQDVYVLFRLTETPDKYGGEFTDRIIRYNNTQNPVKVSDFVANDPIQEWLRDHLPALSGKGPLPAFYYVHKSGWRPKGSTGKGIRIEQAAAIRHAFTHGPVAGYREPQQFFDKGALYWEAFGSEDAPTETWIDEEVSEFGAALAINELVMATAKGLKATEATKDLPETKYLLRLSRYALGLTAVGLQAIRAETFNDYTTLIASKTTFDKYVVPMLRTARRIMRTEWESRRESSAEVRPEYNFARDIAAWGRLAEIMRQEALSDVLPDVR